jgi:hypothetical protein
MPGQDFIMFRQWQMKAIQEHENFFSQREGSLAMFNKKE